MRQDELEALLAQIAPNNDPRRLAFSEATETVEVETVDPDDLTGKATIKKKLPVRVLQWTDPGTGRTLKVQQSPDGSYTKTFQGIDPKQQGAPATTPAQQAQDEQGVEISSSETTAATGKTTRTRIYRRPDGSTYPREDTVQAAPAKPAVAVGTLNTTSPQYATVNADGSLTWAPNPNYQKPNPTPLNLPPTQKHVVYMQPDGTTGVETNPNYQKPSRIDRDPNTGRLIEITEDDAGKPIVRDVTVQTTIKPADIPVLQAKYGEVAQGLGQLAADLNGRVSRGEMTEQQRNEAFKAAHQQAQTAVEEMNGLISNSRATWAQEISQRGQAFAEAANRRSFAGSVLNNAVGEGARVAMSAGPGHGAAIAGGVGALLGIGQQYARGMGGLPEMGEIRMPRALEQARDVGLPGMPAGPGPAAPLPPSGPPAAPAIGGPPNAIGLGAIGNTPAPGGFPTGVSDTTDPGGAPRVRTPASATSAAPPAGMGAALGAGASGSPMGMPAALGGGGYFDPGSEMQSMLTASTSPTSFGGEGGADPSWEEAVKRAYDEASRYGGS